MSPDRRPRRGVRVPLRARVAFLVVAASLIAPLLAGCGGGEGAAAEPDGWHRAELDAPASSIGWVGPDGVVVQTAADGQVGAVRLGWTGVAEPVAMPAGDEPVLGFLPGEVGPQVATVAPDGTVLLHEVVDPERDEFIVFELPPPVPGLEPVALWWGHEDEGPIPVIGYRAPDGDVGIHPMEWGSGELDPQPSLYVAPDRLDTVRISAREGMLLAVGRLGPDPGRLPRRDRAWTMPTIAEPGTGGNPAEPRAWTQVDLDGRFDVVTDVDGWELDLFVAGVHEDAPAAWVLDGEALDLPDVALAGEDAAVLVADPGIDRDPALGIETADGPALFVPGDGEWARTPMPPGRLDDVVHMRDVRRWEEQEGGSPGPADGRIVAIMDGALWWRVA
ncbi:hypothetical protein [Salsipaludibacter albus]|uniref:hypothetical protein n=1 Tax=Salsipaludibacter albus TaxID=2849650 RepID=UPI001EE4147E|nr:hypothetical protein [Salsipaludibacter albus]MBY5163777.1 hypothetical protein [Salsipaludibacter albus]